MKPDTAEAYLRAYLPELQDTAEELATETLPAEDLVQEGSIALHAYLCSLEAEEEFSAGEALLAAERGMRGALEREEEFLHRDEQLVLQVDLLNQSIDRLTAELGTKPNIDELANDMGITQEKVLDILKLTGEEIDEEAMRPPRVRTFHVGEES